MASQGPLYPGTAATLANAGTSENAEAWQTVGNIVSDNGSETSITAATFDSPDISQLIVASNFGFTIPLGATIDGIIVEVERRDQAIGSASDNRVQLATGTTFATLVGDNKAATTTDWPTAVGVATYGTSTDKWNAGLTASMINSSTFAVMLSVQADSANTDVFVDYIRVTVHYTAASGYAAEVAADTPSAWWRMDQTTGQILDSVGVNHSTSLSGTPTYSQTAAAGMGSSTAILLDGSTEAFSVPDATALDRGDTLTLEAWVKRAGNGTQDVIFSKGTNAYIMFLDTDDKLTFGKRFVADIVKSTTTITDTNWHHVAATKSGSTVVLYIDGVDVTGTVTNQTLADTTSALTIGQDNNTWWFNGTLDELAIYSTALSAARILAHYNAGAGISGTVYEQDFTAGLTFSGALTRAPRKALSGGLTFSGALAKRTNKPLAGGLTFSGALARLTQKAFTGGLTFSGALTTSRVFLKALTAELTFNGALTRRTNKALTGGLTFSGALAKQTSHLMAGGLTFSGALAKRTARAFTAGLTFSGSLVRRTGKALSGGLTFSGALTRRTNKVLAGGLTFSGALAKRTSHLMSGAVTFSGALAKRTGHVMTAAVTFTGDLAKRTNKVLAGAVTFVGDLTGDLQTAGTLYFKELAGTVTFSGSLSTGFIEGIRIIWDVFSTVPKHRYPWYGRGLKRRG